MSTRYTLVLGKDADRRHLALADAGATSIGRGRRNDIVLSDTLVSSRHAEIRMQAGGPVVRDAGSRNGTWVNGERVGDDRPLQPGDRLVIGDQSMLVAAEENTETSVTLLEDPAEARRIFASIDTSTSVVLGEGTRREALQSLARADRSRAVLTEMGGVLIEAEDSRDVGRRILDLAFDLIPADRACVILRDENGNLDTGTARNRESVDRGTFPVSRTILTKALDEGLSLLSADAGRDERFREGPSVIIQGIRAAMCAPILGKNTIFGAIYADTRMKAGVFTPEDLEILTLLGIQGGIAIENLHMARESARAVRLGAVGAVVAGLGHDIRNILTALGGGAYMMDHIVKSRADEELTDAWEIVRASTDTITALVNDMVSYSKEQVPDRRPTDLGRVVRTVAKRFEARARERSAALLAHVPPDLPRVPVEGAGIDRVLTNLVENGLDALPETGGTVEIRLMGTPSDVRIEVSDDGCGIPPEHRERIFDLLFSTKGSKGTGFGLAITRKIVTEHGGRIDVDSEPGRGTTFRIALPRG